MRRVNLQKLDKAAVSSFLTEAGYDPHEVEPVGSGAWSTCFGFRHQNEDLVARFGSHLADFEKGWTGTGQASETSRPCTTNSGGAGTMPVTRRSANQTDGTPACGTSGWTTSRTT